MINFSVGPVQSSEQILEVASKSTPYFRTKAFSELMLDNERMILDLLGAPACSRACFVTGSGTASMESVVMSVCSQSDRALVVDGGGFGHRFCELLDLHAVPYDAIQVERGEALKPEDLEEYDNSGYTAFFVNIHETSTGVLYDKKLIADFCRRNGLLLIVDAISSFLSDELNMEEMGASVVIVGSQKGLACQPGVSIVALAPSALDRVRVNPVECMYLDLNLMLKNGERGQTPFTPAVTILMQINKRLNEICSRGLNWEIDHCAAIAHHFRGLVTSLPLEPNLVSPSNAVTYLTTKGFSAKAVVSALETDYGIWVCPNGGDDADTSFRVGHIGNLTLEDNEALIKALCELRHRGFMQQSNL